MNESRKLLEINTVSKPNGFVITIPTFGAGGPEPGVQLYPGGPRGQ